MLYFQDLGGRDSLSYLADGLTEGLIRQLSEVQTLDVISRNGVAPFRSDSIPRDSVARALKAGTLVDGGVERSRRPDSGDRPAGGRRERRRLRRASFEQPAGEPARDSGHPDPEGRGA